MVNELQSAAEAARTLKHERGTAVLTLRVPPATETNFRFRNVPAGLERDQVSFAVLAESVIAWERVPKSWWTLDPKDLEPVEHSAEAVVSLLKERLDILQELSDVVLNFATARAVAIEAERKNFATT